MLSQEPINLDKVKEEDLDKEILRLGMIAELDAVSLYEQLAAKTKDKDIKKVLLDIAKEEKTHISEFETLLLQRDKEQVRESQKAREEIKKLTGKN
ncbi:rubrerythrin [Candidatus Pacearchaeota archaeon RBG_19FT_COMBO_34_9]|nr:MAG: rubrerythrin [Candidatus Pacearchaeota archaeon RBG_19FT_COMBO_34_9]OGJ17050.1 MAG: rubrerythrin [Candidatus Pacearchaeota archaeon RBG_13_33_26]